MNENLRGFSVLIPDSIDHELLCLQVLNCCSKIKNVNVFILSSKRHTFLRYSRNVKRFLYFPSRNDIEWISNINKVVEAYNIDIIMPIFEVGINKILYNKRKLKEKEKLCPLPSLSSFQNSIDKGLLYQHLIKNGLPCPKSVVIKSNKFPENIDLVFPVIAKPVKGFGGGIGIRVLRNIKDIQSYFNNKNFTCDVIVQKFINGYDISCNVLCQNGKLVAYNIQKQGASNSNELTPLSEFSFVENSELLEILKKLIKSFNWSGVANIDFRYDRDEHIFKVIEINPRFWRNVDASAVAGINFPYLCSLLALEQEICLQTSKQIDFVDLKGLVKKIKNKPMLIFNKNYLKSNTTLFFALKDPFPMIYKFIWRTKNIIIQKIFRK